MAKQIEIPKPTKVPANWCWIEMGKLTSMKSGYPFDSHRFVNESSDVTRPLIRIRDVVRGSTETFTDEECPDEYIITRGDILIGMDGDFNVAKWQSKDALLNQRVCCIKSSSALYLDDFLYYYLPDPLKKINDATPSVTVKHLSTKTLAITPVPVPPIAEQQRIVDLIESLFAKLDEAKEKAQSVLDSFETRKAAILHKAFTGELTAKWRAEHGLGVDTWNKKPLVEVTFNHDSRRIPLSQAERSNLERRYDYYGASGVIDKVDRFLFEGRNLLIGEDGANLVTRSKPIAFIADGQYWVNNHAHVLSTKTEMVLDFLCYYINSIDLTPYVTGSAQPKMTQAKMNGIPVPVPSVSEQTEIVRILDSLFTKEQQAKEAAEAVLEKIDLLKKSILARAFRGELGTNDPNEESAIELLKSIV